MALFFLRFLAFALLMTAAFFLGIPPALWFEDGEIGAAAVVTVVGLAAATAALAAHLPVRKRVQRLRRDTPTHDGQPSLPFAPTPGENWPPVDHWVRLPDSVPATPRPSSRVLPFLSSDPVPPDESLRRLLLVRSHPATYRMTAQFSFRYLATLGATFCRFLAFLLTWFGIATVAEGALTGVGGLTVSRVEQRCGRGPGSGRQGETTACPEA